MADFLVPGEVVLRHETAGQHQLVLTDGRVMVWHDGTSLSSTSIPLAGINAITYEKRSEPGWLVAAVLLLAVGAGAGIAVKELMIFVAAAVLAIILVVGYLVGGRQSLGIHAGQVEAEFSVQGQTDLVSGLVRDIESARRAVAG